jgi:acyl-CoA reductase-like NAD-dependent aldehyde dehydrogenase
MRCAEIPGFVLLQATQEVISRVPHTTKEEFDAAVAAAKEAFPAWRDTPVTVRARVMFNFQKLIRDNMVRVTCMLVDMNRKNNVDSGHQYEGRPKPSSNLCCCRGPSALNRVAL